MQNDDDEMTTMKRRRHNDDDEMTTMKRWRHNDDDETTMPQRRRWNYDDETTTRQWQQGCSHDCGNGNDTTPTTALQQRINDSNATTKTLFDNDHMTVMTTMMHRQWYGDDNIDMMAPSDYKDRERWQWQCHHHTATNHLAYVGGNSKKSQQSTVVTATNGVVHCFNFNLFYLYIHLL